MERELPAEMSDRELWRRSRATDAPEDDAAQFLDLAGFADGRLDPDDAERVAERTARNPDDAADVAAARALSAAAINAASHTVIARAAGLVGTARPAGEIVVLRPRRGAPAGRPRVSHRAARWGSLAAAMVVAAWLGFTLGMDASGALAANGRAAEDGYLSDLLDPSPGLLRELAEGART